ncbi:methyltransferase [Halobellus salinisoli]|uniref:methyltransferase n=1 Tax=Halobellus salinisoli TaxID=3108500 RepID=UPI003009FD69
MPVSPNLLERLVLFRLNRGPAPLLDLLGAASFESVSLALDMGLFRTLARSDGPLTAETLAERTGAHPDGVAMLCNFLVAERYLTKGSEGYRLTAMTETWLLPDAETDMGPWLTFWDELVFPFWERELETAVREGEPSQSIYEWFDEAPERWAIAQEGFRATASLVVDDVAEAVTVPEGGGHLLDVGGGHGLYSMELCERYRGLSATIFDVPGAVEAIHDDIPAELTGRIETQAGDYFDDDLGSSYDIALLFNVVHAHDPAENVALFERVADALAPGGRIAVLDQWEGSGRTPVASASLRFVALTYLTTLGASVYSHEEVSAWLEAAEFTDIRRRRVGPLSGMAIVEATKP